MTSTPISTFVILAVVALLLAFDAAAATLFLILKRTDADAITASVAVGSLVLGAFALVAAFWTVRQQQLESQRHRQVETVHRLTDQYEAIFNEIYMMRRDRKEPPSELEADHIHNRYFTVLRRGHWCYTRGLVARVDFEDWTATAINRFARGGSLLDVEQVALKGEFDAQFKKFEKRGAGAREAFRAYIAAVRAEAAKEAGDEANDAIEDDTKERERVDRLRKRAQHVLDVVAKKPFWRRWLPRPSA